MKCVRGEGKNEENSCEKFVKGALNNFFSAWRIIENFPMRSIFSSSVAAG